MPWWTSIFVVSENPWLTTVARKRRLSQGEKHNREGPDLGFTHSPEENTPDKEAKGGETSTCRAPLGKVCRTTTE